MKSEKQKTKWFSLTTLVLILILSIPAYKLIPFGTPDGLDFHNIYSYSKCSDLIASKFENNIYHAHGDDCKDAMARPFVYPPLLYYSTKWVGIFDTFEYARIAWRIFIIVGLLWSIYIWLGTYKRFFIALPFTILLCFQFPMIFALERGNNDILVILTWTLTYYFYKKENFKTSGFFAITTVLMKIYPLFALLIPSLGMFITRQYDKFKNFILGIIIGGVVIFSMFYWLWYSFFLKIKEFAGSRMVLSAFNHSIQYLSNIKILNMTLCLLLLVLWIYRYRYKKDENDINIAGALAISTFYSATSFDYNLITAYPLILILIVNQVEQFNPKRFIILLGLTIGLFGNRYLFVWGNDYGFKVRILIQLISLALLAIEVFPSFYIKKMIIYNFKKVKHYVAN